MEKADKLEKLKSQIAAIDARLQAASQSSASADEKAQQLTRMLAEEESEKNGVTRDLARRREEQFKQVAAKMFCFRGNCVLIFFFYLL